MQVELRPWTTEDAAFCLEVRNDPRLYKWFRQDKPIKLEDQIDFIKKDVGSNEYGGLIVLADSQPVGICGIKSTGEFSIGIMPEHQRKGIASEAMKLMLTKQPSLWSEVFVGNPALEWYISKFNFKITGVEERAYYKSGIGFVDVVKIEHKQPDYK